MQQVILAVVGTPGSGKSTLIQHALDLKSLPTSRISTKKVSLEGVVSSLRIYEFNLHDISVTSEGTPCWPSKDGNGIASQIEGILVIYSITDISSAKPIPAILRESPIPEKFLDSARTICGLRRSHRDTYLHLECHA